MARRSESVTVQVFARYADLLGAGELRVPLDGAATVESVIAYVRGLPGGEHLPERILVAVNRAQALPEQRVTAGDEIALLPPMSGG